MLSHTNTAVQRGGSPADRNMLDTAFWESIECTLAAGAELTTNEIAAAAGLHASTARDRLYKLRDLGEVRLGAGRETASNKRALTWLLGAEDYAARAEKLKPLLTKAQQLGTLQRDPLVAALFGVPSQSVGA